MATDHLRKRILKGVKLNKTGFKEIYTRIGRNFIELPRHPYEDVEKICKANGCYDDEFISKIYNEFQGDLNRVERMVYAYHKKSA